MGRKLFRVLLVLWAGSLWSLAGWVAPTLFHLQPDRHLAGVLAGRLFSIEAYLGIAVAAAALTLARRAGTGVARVGVAGAGVARMGGVYVAAALLAVNEFVLKRFMESARSNGAAGGLTFGAWHGVSAILYIVACLAVLAVIWKEDFR